MCYLPTPVVILERRSVRVTIGRFCAIAIRSGCILFWAVFGCFLIRSNNRWYTALRWSYAEFCTDYIIENTSLSFMAYTPTFKKKQNVLMKHFVFRVMITWWSMLVSFKRAWPKEYAYQIWTLPCIDQNTDRSKTIPRTFQDLQWL